MNYDPKIHHRRSIRLKEYDYSSAGWYYVTVCTQERICRLGDISEGQIKLSEAGRIAERSWKWLGAHFTNVELDSYVIMPNHLHGIVIMNERRRGGSRTAPTEIQSKPLGRLIGAFKTTSTKEINLVRGTPGKVFWQRGFYEHIVRNDADLDRIRTYIRDNPLQWALDEENPDNRI